jgi:hypothetical protein
MADSGFPFFFLIIQIGMPVNELERLARSLSLHQMRVKVLGLSQARGHGQGYRQEVQKNFAAQEFICYTEFVLSVSDEQNPKPSQKPTNDDGRSMKETRQRIPTFRRGPGRKGVMKERP